MLPLAVVAGCDVFNPNLLASDAGQPNCNLRLPPEPPAAATPGDVGRLHFGLKDISFQYGEGWRTTGYDLDGLCSDSPDPLVECLPAAASAPPEIDGVGGIDNVFGHEVAPLLDIISPRILNDTPGIQNRGLGVVVLRLDGWNGTGNDAEISMAVMQSVFATPAPPDGGVPTIEYPDGGIIYVNDPDASGNPPSDLALENRTTFGMV